MIRVQYLNIVASLDIFGGHDAFAGLVDGEQSLVTAVELDGQSLQIQQDVDNIFLHPFDHGVLVHNTRDAHLGGRVAAHGGQQDATQGISQRVTIPALERLERDTSLAGGDAVDLNDARLQQITGVRHISLPSENQAITWNKVQSPSAH